MKKFKTLVFSILVLGSGMSVQAQTSNSNSRINKMRFGAYIAPTASWMKPTTTKDDSGEFAVKNNGTKIGYIFGLMGDYNFAENYAVSIGLQVNTTGGKILAERIDTASTVAPRVNKADYDYILQYLEIPVALKLNTNDIGGFRFFGQLGLNVGFNISKKANYSVDYINSAGTAQTVSGEKEKLKGNLGDIAPINFQMSIGAGAEYPLSDKLTAYFGLFFNNGFLPDATRPNEFKMPYEGSFKDGNTRLNNFALRLGLYF